MSEGAKLPSAVRIFWYFWLLGALWTFDVSLFAFLLDSHEPGYDELLRTFTLWAIVVELPIWAWLSWTVIAPFGRVRAAIEAGTRPRDIDPYDSRRALTLYRPLSRIAFFTWLLTGISWPVVVWIWGTPEMMSLALMLMIAAFAVGALISRGMFSSFYIYTHFRIGPILLAEGMEHLRPFKAVRAWHNIAWLIAVLGIIQPTINIILLYQARASTALYVYIAVSTLAVALSAAAATFVSISGTLGKLAGAMKRVRLGNLQAHAVIRNLDTFGLVSEDFNEMTEGLRQREFLRETFRRYISQQVAEEIIAGRVELGGELRTATVLFSDIRGFTTMAEDMSPQEVVSFLNSYLDVMVEVVFDHGGVLDKFIGDAIMAVWGVPRGVSEAEDARAAVRCAIEMSDRLDRLNEARRANGQVEIEIGIGVHTGPLVAGNIGSEQFMEYTVIGDTVNLTARLEGMTKGLGTRILLSGQTAKLVEGEIACEHLVELEVRGRARPVEVFRLSA